MTPAKAIPIWRRGTEVRPGVVRSADGMRQVRMTASDLAKTNNHAGAPHFNFEEGMTVKMPSGRKSFIASKNSHVFIEPKDM